MKLTGDYWLLVVILSTATKGQLYPFGPTEMDSSLERNDDGSSDAIFLQSGTFRFLGENHTLLYVNNNGHVSLNTPFDSYTPRLFALSLSNPSLIAPLWSDVDTRRANSGTVFYRETNNISLLNRVAREVRLAFPDLQSFSPQFLFIATWNRVAGFGLLNSLRNTFQCVLVSDSQFSFVIFLYGQIQWPQFHSRAAVAGINGGDGVRGVNIPGSLSTGILNMTLTSNVGRDGMWVFRVDGPNIEPIIQIVCFDNAACNGTVLRVSSARDCCVSTNGTHYSDGESCFRCTVYGFLQSNITESERGQGYSVRIGYLKQGTGIVDGRITTRPGGTAGLNTDFQISSTTFIIRPTTPQDIIVTFHVDRIAQEPVETAQLGLEIDYDSNRGTNVFVLDTLDLVISDSDRVVFQLTETGYSANEQQKQIIPTINKNLRIANPVEFLLTPYTVDGAIAASVPLPNVPPDDNRFSPNRAQLTEGRKDFSDNVLQVRFEADEVGLQVNDVSVPIVIFDDEIDEAQEEVFVIDITLVNSTNDKINISRKSSQGRIIDNDELQIGFQNMIYTFVEPDLEKNITDVVFLEKQGGVITDQTYVIVIELNEVTPNSSIPSATLQTQDADNDYTITGPDVRSLVLEFPPDQQTLAFDFLLYPDLVTEGTEAFQVTSQPSAVEMHPAFTAPTVLSPSTFIVIEDNHRVVVGFEQNYTVSEDNGTFMACFRVFSPLPEQEFSESLFIDLVVDTKSGSADEFDYTPIRFSRSLSNKKRRTCLPVSITNDSRYEDTERFELALEFIVEGGANQVDICPSVVVVTILDTTPLEIGFINAPYSGIKAGGVVTFEVGVTNGVTLDREVVVDFSTVGAGKDAMAGSDYVAISNMTLTFGPSQSNTTVNVTVIDDNSFGLSKSFNGSLSASAALERFTLSPATALASITAVRCTDGTGAPIVCNRIRFDQQNYTVHESDGFLILSVVSDRPVETNFTLLIEGGPSFSILTNVSNIGASLPFVNMSLEFPAGANMTTANITITNDDISLEFLEIVRYSLTIPNRPQDVSLEGGFSTDVFLLDDDNIAVVELEKVELRVSEADLNYTLCVNSSSATAVPLKVQITDSSDSALRDVDYERLDLYMRIEPSSRKLCFNGSIMNDVIALEGEERFYLDLQVSVSLNITSSLILDPSILLPEVVVGMKNRTTVIIIDDDDVNVNLNQTKVTVHETNKTVSMCVNKDVETDTSLSVLLTTINGTAKRGEDFGSNDSYVVTFEESTNNTACIDIDIVDDEIFEGTESFQVTLSNDTNDTRINIREDMSVSTIFIDDSGCRQLPSFPNGNTTYSDIPNNGVCTQVSTMASNGTRFFNRSSIAINNCSDTFVLSGPAIQICIPDTDGITYEWVPGQRVFCQPLCRDLPQLSNGTITYRNSKEDENTPKGLRSINTTAIYTCNKNFYLTNGSVTRTCREEGEVDGIPVEAIWSGTDGICVPHCSNVESFSNGTVSYDPHSSTIFGVGTTATYRCNNESVLIGNKTRQCQNTSTWSGEPPECRRPCPTLHCPQRAICNENSDSFAASNFVFNITYTCENGFFLSGMDEINCTTSGEWTDDPPTCESIECPLVQDIENGRIDYNPNSNNITNSFVGVGTVAIATVECIRGHAPVPGLSTRNLTRTCEDDDGMDAVGRWSGEEPSCIAQCPLLDNVTNGSITYTPDRPPFVVGTNATYNCADGFFLNVSNGTDTRTCRNQEGVNATGSWSGQEPTCVRIECLPLNLTVDGLNVSYDTMSSQVGYELGTNATYSCDSNFVLSIAVGAKVRTCQNDDGMDAVGVWSGQEPSCARIECPPLNLTVDGLNVSYDTMSSQVGYELGTNATYSCDSNFFLSVAVGARGRTCQNDDGMDAVGVWSGQEPSCVRIECPPLNLTVDGLNVSYNTMPGWAGYELGTNATYSCDSNFVLSIAVGAKVRTCQNDDGMDAVGVWSGQEPSCVLIKCPPLTMNGSIISDTAPNMTLHYELGTILTYVCNESSEPMNATCVSNGSATGTWSPEPSCDIQPTVSLQSTVSPPTTISTATFGSIETSLISEDSTALIAASTVQPTVSLQLTASPLTMVPTATTGSTETSEDSTALIAGVTSGVLGFLLLCVLVIVIFLSLATRRQRPKEADFSDSHRLTSHYRNFGKQLSLRNIYQSQMKAAMDQVPDTLKIPTKLLKLSDIIGQGAFGIVYKGILTDWNGTPAQRVAVKTLKGFFTLADIQGMVSEITKMQEFHHPHIMSLIGVCLDARAGVSIVMPFVANGSLLDYLKKNRDSLELTSEAESYQIISTKKLLLKMCHQIALGMAYLAEHKFVHRDLAARNCMLDSDGSIKVGDFGLAEDVYSTGYFRQQDREGVKLPYRWMALESLNDAIFNEKTDVWSYGVTVWEVFSGGRTPYPGVDPMSLVRLLRNGGRLETPNNAACSQEIAAVMASCWYKCPEERPDFSRLAIEMDQFLSTMSDYFEFKKESLVDSHGVDKDGYNYVLSPEEQAIDVTSTNSTPYNLSMIGVMAAHESQLLETQEQAPIADGEQEPVQEPTIDLPLIDVMKTSV